MAGLAPNMPSAPNTNPPAGSQKPADFSGSSKTKKNKQPPQGDVDDPFANMELQSDLPKKPTPPGEDYEDDSSAAVYDEPPAPSQQKQGKQTGIPTFSDQAQQDGSFQLKDSSKPKQAQGNTPFGGHNGAAGVPGGGKPQTSTKPDGNMPGAGAKLPAGAASGSQAGSQAKAVLKEGANQAANKGVQAVTGGVGGFKAGDAAERIAKAKERGETKAEAAVKSVLNDFTIFGIPLKLWLAVAALVSFVTNSIIFIGLSVAVCQGASYKILGLDAGLAIADQATGFDVSGICDQVNSFITGFASGIGFGGGGGVVRQPGAACSPLVSGAGSEANLATTCFSANAREASGIVRQESGGDPLIPSGVDKCQPGGEVVSWGLFQINISANRIGNLNCPSAFDRAYSGSNRQCRVVNRALYDQCVAAAKDATQNILAACRISDNGNNWSPWGANRICRF